MLIFDHHIEITWLTMEMLNSKLILMLQLLNLLLRRLLVMLLVLLRRFDSLLHLLTNQQDLAVFVVEMLWFDLAPSQVAESINNPTIVSYEPM